MSIKDRLLRLGLTEAQVSSVIDIMIEGISVTVSPTSFTFESSDVTIKHMPNTPPLICNHELRVEGLDPRCISSLSVPSFSYCDTLPLTVEVNILPLSFVQDLPLG